MTVSAIECLIVSDFNCENLAGYLSHQRMLQLQASCSSFGQLWPTLLELGHSHRSTCADVLVVWTRPQGIAPITGEAIGNGQLQFAIGEVDRFCDTILAIENRFKHVFIPLWVLPTTQRGIGFADLKPGGMHWLLGRMNQRLIDNLSQSTRCFALNTQKWIEQCRVNAFDSKLWYMAKIPFHRSVFQEAALEISSALCNLRGSNRKLLILDLDDTLWGGVLGDVGWENLRLGGHDAIGESFVEFQFAIKALKQQGVLLAIASKNEDSVAIQAIENHPAMILKLDDFVARRINWNDKAQNIVAMVEELNVGVDSVVFIDDNPNERERVKSACPEVLVPDWPKDKMEYVNALSALRCFDKANVTSEDSARTQMYHAERKRDAAKKAVGSVDDWLASLEMVIRVERISESNIKRATQLLNKTNQMNLSTRRMTESEFLEWCNDSSTFAYAFSVSDKFGDSGLTGVGTIKINGDEARIQDFVLSCRVFGRKVEEIMVSTLVDAARLSGVNSVTAIYIETERNKVTRSFFESSAFVREGDTFSWSTESFYPFPDWVVVSRPPEVSAAQDN